MFSQMFNQNDFLSHAEEFTPYLLLSAVSYLKTVITHVLLNQTSLLMSSNSTENLVKSRQYVHDTLASTYETFVKLYPTFFCHALF